MPIPSNNPPSAAGPARNYGGTEPIAARATAPGQSALALVRTSGEDSLELLAKVFSRPKALLEAPGNTVLHGWILARPEKNGAADGPDGGAAADDGANSSLRIDEVLVSVYRAPASYTGENGADISCHGGEAVVRAVLAALKAAGFSEALPGEFSFRAFMNGKLDLTRAESVMELVSAKTGAAAEHAVRRLSGALEKEILSVRDDLLEALATAELYLDYPEDEIEGGEDPLPLCRKAALKARARLKTLAASYSRERLFAEGLLAVIAGKPNAGKSSLFNALIGEDRSIVTEIPGTTRDWIEAALSIEGVPVRLADTAGLREERADGVSGGDPLEAFNPVEKIGIQRSKALLEEADIIIYVIDGTAGFQADDRAFIEAQTEKPLIPVWNKADLAPLPVENKENCIAASAKTGGGIDLICSALVKAVFRGKENETVFSAGLGTRRQKDLIDKAAASLEETLSLVDNKAELEIIAPSIRGALNALGEISGEVSTTGILEELFSRFCVGK